MADRVEEDRIAARTIVRVGLFIFTVLAATLLLLGWLAHHYRVSRPGNPDTYPIPSPPRIDPVPRSELEMYLTQQRDQLGAYRWIDRERGLVQIPIERAMALYADQAAKGGKR